MYSSITHAHIRKACTSLISYNDHAVDKLLRVLSILILHLHDAICAVITDWKFNASRSERWKQNNEFMKDVHKRFRNESSSVEMRLKLLSDNVLKNDYLIEISEKIKSCILEKKSWTWYEWFKELIVKHRKTLCLREMLLTQSMMTSNRAWVLIMRWIDEFWMNIDELKHFEKSWKWSLTCKASTRKLLWEIRFSVSLTEQNQLADRQEKSKSNLIVWAVIRRIDVFSI